MQRVLTSMLSKYKIETLDDKKNAIKEIVQEVVLCGLARGGFFNKAAFYGDTALRIFYGLDRFSEDLDFSLLSPNLNFDLEKYLPFVENETKALGLNFTATIKEKTVESTVKSAFLKGNTKERILIFYQNQQDADFIQKDESIRIKFEVDVNPPVDATYETKIQLLPSPYQVKTYDLPSLFAGKIHACLCRRWGKRIKGRDFYDYVFFLSMRAKVNLNSLKAKLVESNYISKEYNLTLDNLKDLLNARFKEVDFKSAKDDVFPFIKDKSKLDLWCSDFFIEITKGLQNT